MADPEKQEQVQKSFIQNAKAYGEILLTLLSENPLPPALLATFIFAQSARPFQTVPMLFPPLLLFSTYLNLQGYKIDSAGTTAALSGTYLVLAGRRKAGGLSLKFGTRGVIRGLTMGLCLANLVGGGLAYGFGSRTKEDEKRKAKSGGGPVI